MLCVQWLCVQWLCVQWLCVPWLCVQWLCVQWLWLDPQHELLVCACACECQCTPLDAAWHVCRPPDSDLALCERVYMQQTKRESQLTHTTPLNLCSTTPYPSNRACNLSTRATARDTSNNTRRCACATPSTSSADTTPPSPPTSTSTSSNPLVTASCHCASSLK